MSCHSVILGKSKCGRCTTYIETSASSTAGYHVVCKGGLEFINATDLFGLIIDRNTSVNTTIIERCDRVLYPILNKKPRVKTDTLVSILDDHREP